MTNYESHLQQRGLTEYTLDGAINPERWNASPVKIMFYLKENYGYQGCGIIDIQNYAHTWLADGNKTYVRSVRLAAAIQLAITRGQPLSPPELESISNEADLLHATLDTIAVVNIKKHSGESTSNDAEIRDESRANASLLNAQIAGLAPTIILSGGTVCWHSLIFDIGLFNVSQDCLKFETVVCRGTVLCHSNHPSARRPGEFDLDRLHRSMLSAYQHATP